MMLLRGLGLLALVCATAVVACTEEETETTPTSSSGTGGTGGSASGSSSSSTGTGGGTGGSGLTEIQCDPDTYTNITGECDLLQQDVCGPGQMCDVVSSTATCIEQGGLKGKGDECSSQSECQAGLKCLPGMNKCSPYCCPATDEPCEGGLCDVHLSFSASTWAFLCSYSPSCTLLEHTCDDGLYCHVAAPEKGIAVCDEPAGLVDEGEACQYRNNCGESQWCTNGVCRYHCSIEHWDDDPPPALSYGGCPEGQTCIAHWQLAQFPDIGICLPSS